MALVVFFFLRYNYSFKALISTFTWAVLKDIKGNSFTPMNTLTGQLERGGL